VFYEGSPRTPLDVPCP